MQIRSKTLLVLFDFGIGAPEEPRKLAGGKAALRAQPPGNGTKNMMRPGGVPDRSCHGLTSALSAISFSAPKTAVPGLARSGGAGFMQRKESGIRSQESGRRRLETGRLHILGTLDFSLPTANCSGRVGAPLLFFPDSCLDRLPGSPGKEKRLF